LPQPAADYGFFYAAFFYPYKHEKTSSA